MGERYVWQADGLVDVFNLPGRTNQAKGSVTWEIRE